MECTECDGTGKDRWSHHSRGDCGHCRGSGEVEGILGHRAVKTGLVIEDCAVKDFTNIVYTLRVERVSDNLKRKQKELQRVILAGRKPSETVGMYMTNGSSLSNDLNYAKFFTSNGHAKTVAGMWDNECGIIMRLVEWTNHGG